MKKYILGLVFTAILLTTANISSAAAASFPDTNGNTLYFRSILILSEKGIINGKGDGNFYPDDCVNRAEMLKLLFKAQNVPIATTAAKITYSDVEKGSWYEPYVNTATIRGTVNGYQDGTFQPGKCVSRVEAIKMIVHEFAFEELENPGSMPQYTDMSTTAWYYPTFSTAISLNIVPRLHSDIYNYSDPDFKFYPHEGMPRNEAAELIARALYLKDKNFTIYPLERTPSNFETSFSKCQPLTNFTSKTWFNDLKTHLANYGETTRIGTQETLDSSSGCLSEDSGIFIFALAADTTQANSRLFKYNTTTNKIYETDYFFFPINPSNSSRLFVIISGFDQQNAFSIPLIGSELAGDKGVITYMTYHYDENALFLTRQCNLYTEITTLKVSDCKETPY